MTGADVKDIRERAGLTQPQLGKVLGVTLRTVRNWEAGGTLTGMAQLVLEAIDAALLDQGIGWARRMRDKLAKAKVND